MPQVTFKPKAPRCVCPRCNYDLLGEAARWNDDDAPDDAFAEGAACPASGTCAECGLVFLWRFIYRPQLAGARWFVERAKDKQPARMRFSGAHTAARALMPWRFWKQLTLETPHSVPRRMLWLFAVLVLWPVFGFAAASFTALCIERMFGPGGMFLGWAPPLFDVWQTKLIDFLGRYLPLEPVTQMHPWMLAFIAGTLIYPFVLVCLPWTRARSKVRLTHVARASAYALAPIAPLAFLSMCASLLEVIDRAAFGRGFSLSFFAGNAIDPFVKTSFWGATDSEYIAWWLWPFIIVWFLVWWACALKFGFRMKDWFVVFIAIAVPGIIAQVLAALFNLSMMA